MIKLERVACPTELTHQKQAELTQEFKLDSSKRVWDKDYIKDALRTMSYYKCCFCEVNVSEESKYMEVEHFECKSVYPDKVVLWSNLLPACRRCNAQKGTYDVADGALIDPTAVEPKLHIFMRDNYRFRHRDNLGETTVEELYLNDSERLVYPRFKIGEKINNAISIIERDFEKLAIEPASRRKQNIVKRSIAALLHEAAPTTEFSATAATCIVKSVEFNKIRRGLETLGLWDADLERAHLVAVGSSLAE